MLSMMDWSPQSSPGPRLLVGTILDALPEKATRHDSTPAHRSGVGHSCTSTYA